MAPERVPPQPAEEIVEHLLADASRATRRQLQPFAVALQVSGPLEPPREEQTQPLPGVVETLRVNHHDGLQVFNLFPDRIELRVRQLAAVDVGADDEAAHVELFDRVLELFDGEVRLLHGRHPTER